MHRLGIIAHLTNFVFKFLKERALVISQIRFNPVFCVKEHLAVRFPNTIIAHPFPILALIFGQNEGTFKTEFYTAYKLLNGIQGLPCP